MVFRLWHLHVDERHFSVPPYRIPPRTTYDTCRVPFPLNNLFVLDECLLL